MAQARSSASRPAGGRSLGHKVAGMTQRAWMRYWTRKAERATVAILHALDERTLEDIGLDRSEIESMAHGQPRERRICWAPAAACGAPGRC